MDRIALQILEDGWEQDGRVLRQAVATLHARLGESTDGRWAAAAFELNRIYNIMEKAFERLCQTFENHLEKTGRYHDTRRALLMTPSSSGSRSNSRAFALLFCRPMPFGTFASSRASGISFVMLMTSISTRSASRRPPKTRFAASAASTAGASRSWRKSAAAIATRWTPRSERIAGLADGGPAWQAKVRVFVVAGPEVRLEHFAESANGEG